MKRFAATGLLLLLLYHTFGLVVAVWLFEDVHPLAAPVDEEVPALKLYVPSLPYATPWENPDTQQGLLRSGDDFYRITHQRHENDTLYVVLEASQNARERFQELASLIQDMTSQSDASTPDSPMGKILRLLSQLQKLYLAGYVGLGAVAEYSTLLPQKSFPNPTSLWLSLDQRLATPPPELI